MVSETMQNTSAELSIAVSLMNNLTDYRTYRHERAIESAKQLATELDVEIIFKSKRIRRKRFFEYESTDEVSNACEPEKYFKNYVSIM